MKIFTCVVALLIMHNVSFAQKRLLFHSKNYLGLLEGEKGPALQLQSVNGFQHSGWFGGIGIGLDYYRFRTIPLFLSIVKDLQQKSHTFYVSVDGGINLVWEKEEMASLNQILQKKYPAAFYWSGGLGYKIGLGAGKEALLLDIGYSYKHIREKQNTTSFCNDPPCAPILETFNYGLRRLSLRLGLQL